jgi:hypothetical protein
MKNIALVLCLGFAGLGAAERLSGLALTLVNRTGETLVEVFISSDTAAPKDVLGDEVMLNSERLLIDFAGAEGTYTIRAVAENSDEYVLSKRALRNGATVSISRTDLSKDRSSSEYGLTIVNNTGKTAHGIMVFPKDANGSSGAPDLLGEENIILQGKEFQIRLPLKKGATIFTIQLTDEEGTVYTRTGVDVTRENRIYFTAKDK